MLSHNLQDLLQTILLLIKYKEISRDSKILSQLPYHLTFVYMLYVCMLYICMLYICMLYICMKSESFFPEKSTDRISNFNKALRQQS